MEIRRQKCKYKPHFDVKIKNLSHILTLKIIYDVRNRKFDVII